MKDDITAAIGAAPARSRLARRGRAGLGDNLFRWTTLAFALAPVLLIAAIGARLYTQSAVTRRLFGWGMLERAVWDPIQHHFGALWFAAGTLATSALALLIAVPIGVGAALFLTEVAPRRLAAPLAFLIELLAAIPSVIYGLWGLFFLAPWLSDHLYPWLQDHFGALPVFSGAPYPTNILVAGLVLAIMVLPFITSVSREVIRTVPRAQREAALGLGATRWETIRTAVLPSARSGIIGAVILGLGRAIGETMAVVMVIGNSSNVTTSLLQGGYTMPSVLANEFGEALNDPIHGSALVEIALILFVVTFIVNAIARLLILLTSRNAASPAQNSTPNPVRERAVEIGGAALKWAVLVALVGAVLLQAASDVHRGGVRGLFGPVELLALAVAAVRLVTHFTRGTAGWERWRKVNSAFMHGMLSLCALLACFVLGLLLVYVSVQGAKALNLPFFTRNEQEGGVLNGLVGTPVLVGIACLIGIPVGLMGGIFLAEFGQTRLGSVIRFMADVLNGIPSVVIGMFGYAAFVIPFGGHFSAIAGGAALGVMMVPTIMRTTEEIMRLVPQALRESSLGLGATKWRTVVSVVLPAARAGIMTGVLLAIARIAGETAPLLFTAFGNQMVTARPTEMISSLTMVIYRFAMAGDATQQAQAWTGALVLLGFVLVVSLAARFLTRNRYATN